MSSVMILCPTTGRAVSTAIEMEPEVLRLLPHLGGRMNCPACGQEHRWFTSRAWLERGPRPAEPQAARSEAA